MNKHWILMAAVLLASPAFGETPFNSLFDGAGAPLSALPVVHADVPAVGGTTDASAPAAPAPSTDAGAKVPVAIEILVTPAKTALAQGVGRLSKAYGFAVDSTFAPVPLAYFHILPYPEVPAARQAYLVRGVLPAERVQALKADGSVRELWQGDPSSDEKALQELLLRYEDALRDTEGVKDVYLGYDCGMTEAHVHLQPHHPRIIVVVDPSADGSSVRQQVFESAPILAAEPVVFQPAR